MNVFIIGKGVTAKAILNTSHSGLFTCVDTVEDADVLVASPGIPPQAFPQTSKPIIAEVEFAFRLLQKTPIPPIVIGVTGTNGKTTVTSLIGHVLGCPVAGNIGVPFITYAGVSSFFTEIVIELSSFQLETCTTLRPKIAIITTITEDHLKRHHTMAEYIFQKKKILQAQTADDFVVFNADDPLVVDMVKDAKAQKIPFSITDPDMLMANNVQLVGLHNKLNALAAIKTAKILGYSKEKIAQQLRTFEGVKHRIQYVGSYEDRQFYNDSKATNPDSTLVALQAFSKPVCIILCGEDKGLELESFVTQLQKTAKKAVVFSEVGRLVTPISQRINPDFPIFQAKDLKDSIQKAMLETTPGDVILFSPSSSSFDMFKSFEHRGDVFIQTVKELYETT